MNETSDTLHLPPDAARTEYEASQLKSLPLDERKDRVRRALSAAFDELADPGEGSGQLVISRYARDDLGVIAKAYGEAYARDVRRYIDALAKGDHRLISRRYTRGRKAFWRFRTLYHDIYFLKQGGSIAVGRILIPYFMRPDKGQPGMAPRPPRLS